MNEDGFFRRNLRPIFAVVGTGGYLLFVLWAGLDAIQLWRMVLWGAVVVCLYSLVDKYLMDSGPENPTIAYRYVQRWTNANTGLAIFVVVAVSLLEVLPSSSITVKLLAAGSSLLAGFLWHQYFVRCLCPRGNHTVPTLNGVPNACPACGLKFDQP